MLKRQQAFTEYRGLKKIAELALDSQRKKRTVIPDLVRENLCENLKKDCR